MVNHILHIYLPSSSVSDRIIWKTTTSGEYSVKSGYLSAVGIETSQNSVGAEVWIAFWKHRWKLDIPPKWSLFVWKLFHRILLVRALLLRRGIILQAMCPICKKAEESLEHFCFQFPISKYVCRGTKLGLDFDVGEELLVQEWFIRWFNIAPDEAAIIEAIQMEFLTDCLLMERGRNNLCKQVQHGLDWMMRVIQLLIPAVLFSSFPACGGNSSMFRSAKMVLP
ncbi:hypothetical protein LOK49_LG01G01033 [Camellia lanceoleosa]|uniref:Uncharacterized protein n=1 Tax=Camellia lanceoleosa TaxID=1840588 RepID=A0ACC0J0D9_9ERIC|nr:hypothetical protein LOK49_LG01G01033 [Camellia lanceoleosa]